MIKLYLTLAGLVVSFLGGWLVHGWYTDSRTTRAIEKRDQSIAGQNQRTDAATLAATTHIEALHTSNHDIHQAITHYEAHHALPTCIDHLGDDFRLLYDAGSAAALASSPSSLFPPAPQDPQSPPR